MTKNRSTRSRGPSYRVLRGFNYPSHRADPGVGISYPVGGETRHEPGELVSGLPLSAAQLEEQVDAGVLVLQTPDVVVEQVPEQE